MLANNKGNLAFRELIKSGSSVKSDVLRESKQLARSPGVFE